MAEVDQHLLLLVHLLAEDMEVADSLLNHLVEVTATEVTAAVVEAVEDLPATDTDRLLVLSPQRQFNPEATAEATDQLYLLLLRRRRRRWIRPRRIGTSPLYINRWIWP